MSLTDSKVKTVKSKDKAYKLTDGKGLYLLVKTNSSKYWQYRFRLDAKPMKEYPSWPPTSGQFRSLCMVDPNGGGLPNEKKAWSQICQAGLKFCHGVILAAANDFRCDAYNLRNMNGFHLQLSSF